MVDGNNNAPVQRDKTPRVTMTHVFVLILAVAVAFIAGIRSDYISATLMGQKSTADTLDLSTVQSLYKELAINYDGKLDKEKLIAGAKHGMINAVGDPYTVYFTADEAKEFLSDLEGTFEGIGAELGKKDGALTIISTIDGSPAKKAGLQAGDGIMMVNDEETTNWSVEQAVKKIRGEKGTTVKLTIARAGQDKALEISVIRDKITDPSVKTEITPDNVGIIRITRFGQTDTVQLARQAAQDFKAKGVKGIIVDLRGNGGGYLQSAQDIASLWLDNKVVVTERTGGKVVDTLYSHGDPVVKGIPTVLLVNEGSASASEILAGALHDNSAATIVGKKTYGKGVVQDVRTLRDGGSLKVTIASWYTPKGKNISKEGITPDHVIDLTEADVAAGRDPQKDKALELLK
jgi:carboxyl-terminal processing protease